MLVFETGSTNSAKEFVKDNLHQLGKIISIEHTRNSDKVEYQTTIKGEFHKMLIYGGLSSGYTGEGTSGLISILKHLGVDNETAQQLVLGNTDNIHSFRHIFKY